MNGRPSSTAHRRRVAIACHRCGHMPFSHVSVSPTAGICRTCLKSFSQGASHVYQSNANARVAESA